jgi:O-antigen/teichoic acid export membrane protein
VSSRFRNILALATGDFVAKALSFCAFVYAARTLGVEAYGTLEFALSILTYLVMFGDAGLEMWGTREIARGSGLRGLMRHLVPLRIGMSFAGLAALAILYRFLPEYEGLAPLLLVFAMTILAQGVSVKWALMGRERFREVGTGLALAQFAFAFGVFGWVDGPEDLLHVAAFKVCGDVVSAGWFFLSYRRRRDDEPASAEPEPPRRARTTLAGALPLGLTHLFAMASFNFDTVLLGFLTGTAEVGLYNAAYKPVTVVLAMPSTYFVGLFPILSRAFAEDRVAFRAAIERSLQLTCAYALPLGVGAWFVADPLILFLFGEEFAAAAPAMRVLACSAAIVVLRGTFKQGLLSTGHHALDLRCSGTATAVNLVLNVILIPRYGLLGAAYATLVSEVLWFSLAHRLFTRHTTRVDFLQHFWRPVVAAAVMTGVFVLLQPWHWIAQAVAAVAAYGLVLASLGGFREQAAGRDSGADGRR